MLLEITIEFLPLTGVISPINLYLISSKCIKLDTNIIYSLNKITIYMKHNCVYSTSGAISLYSRTYNVNKSREKVEFGLVFRTSIKKNINLIYESLSKRYKLKI